MCPVFARRPSWSGCTRSCRSTRRRRCGRTIRTSPRGAAAASRLTAASPCRSVPNSSAVPSPCVFLKAPPLLVEVCFVSSRRSNKPCWPSALWEPFQVSIFCRLAGTCAQKSLVFVKHNSKKSWCNVASSKCHSLFAFLIRMSALHPNEHLFKSIPKCAQPKWMDGSLTAVWRSCDRFRRLSTTSIGITTHRRRTQSARTATSSPRCPRLPRSPRTLPRPSISRWTVAPQWAREKNGLPLSLSNQVTSPSPDKESPSRDLSRGCRTWTCYCAVEWVTYLFVKA